MFVLFVHYRFPPSPTLLFDLTWTHQEFTYTCANIDNLVISIKVSIYTWFILLLWLLIGMLFLRSLTLTLSLSHFSLTCIIDWLIKENGDYCLFWIYVILSNFFVFFLWMKFQFVYLLFFSIIWSISIFNSPCLPFCYEIIKK